jgi:hypothetical protein
LPSEVVGGVFPLRMVGTEVAVVVEIAGPAALIAVLCNGIKAIINEALNKTEVIFL